jgi:hypothetical protein
MKYMVEAKAAELNIKVENVGDKQDTLVQSLQECVAGRCSCPTSQYEKLDTIDMQRGRIPCALLLSTIVLHWRQLVFVTIVGFLLPHRGQSR